MASLYYRRFVKNNFNQHDWYEKFVQQAFDFVQEQRKTDLPLSENVTMGSLFSSV